MADFYLVLNNTYETQDGTTWDTVWSTFNAVASQTVSNLLRVRSSDDFDSITGGPFAFVEDSAFINPTSDAFVVIFIDGCYVQADS